MVAIHGFLSSHFYIKQCYFKTSYDGEMSEDPFDVCLTKIGCAKGAIFYLEGLSKIR